MKNYFFPLLFSLCLLPNLLVAQETMPNGFQVEKQLIIKFDNDAKPDTIRLVGDGTNFNYRLLMQLSSLDTTPSIAISNPDDPGEFPIYPGNFTFSNKVLQYGFGTPGTANYYYAFKLRFNPTAKKIQVIGFELDYNSGPAGSAHTNLSFNLLTGDFIQTEKFYGSLSNKKTKRWKGKNTSFQQLYVDELNAGTISKLAAVDAVGLATINRLAASIHSHSFLYGYKSTNYDSLAIRNQRLTKALLRYAKQHPTFLEQGNPFFQDSYLSVLTSVDKKFRIICWNDGLSGTMQQWRAIAFWKTKSGLQSKILGGDDAHRDIYSLEPQYWNINSYQLDDGQTAYLVRGIGHGSNRIKFSFVKAFVIQPSGQLNEDFKLFKTPSKTLNHIFLRIDLMSARHTGYLPSIYLSKDGKTLYIPVADKQGKLTLGKHLIYQFDGRYFVFQGVE